MFLLSQINDIGILILLDGACEGTLVKGLARLVRDYLDLGGYIAQFLREKDVDDGGNVSLGVDQDGYFVYSLNAALGVRCGKGKGVCTVAAYAESLMLAEQVDDIISGFLLGGGLRDINLLLVLQSSFMAMPPSFSSLDTVFLSSCSEFWA